ncbi:3-hydroxyacyl-CoA dehydrogenase NAD-binding domain-containing protein [Noviherbaspirillum sp.]|uniref:3-hydroxyacyl-CoA dehydrogenase NAD-binding domain-containing protein n=1 Tax=Noviherbaspirillum sp. TaxID=1926288 RepID=UPI002D337170|nr:3-hydroxyacyl-CoA dehydrogenase NAD-binding domain-containing protein [Noviherbaspirillum sp.]HZW19725.1 3-hydroxyacyl-CoA dehydrogenase NAD-binding domain-containing protein [Noviherbaspirillum sp.]
MSIQWQADGDNIITLTIDMPGQPVNTMNAAFQQALAATLERLEKERGNIKGVVITSAKDTFFAGGDLRELIAIPADGAQECFRMVEQNKAVLRRLEKLGCPVVAALNGSALGGGLELALACHYRISLDNPKIQFGFPEVTLGLLPGAGGVIRTVRLLGLQEAMPYLVEGKRMPPQEALNKGFVHALATDKDHMLAQAREWIAANPAAKQPWDSEGYRMPGGAPNTPKLLPMQMAAPAMLREKTRGLYPAPEAILCAMVEGAQVDFDNALVIEGRYFTRLATGQVAKNMIGTFFFQMQEVSAGKSRPRDIPKWKAGKVGILGAGMMGAGIAWANASRGIPCVLKDVGLEQAEKGKSYSARLLEKRVRNGKMTEARAKETLALIQPAASAQDLAGCDLVIEAVFEKRELKAAVTREAEQFLAPGGVMASNTSTLPITGLAQASTDQSRFIGLHFFSPVDKMQLVEIIRGAKTSEETLARAYDYVQQIGKLPIVVNDSRGFFTSRVFATFVNEGIAMLGEGVPAALIENAALSVGMPVGPLAVQDEVALTLSLHVMNQTRADLAAEGKPYRAHPAEAIVERMVNEFKRCGKAAGGGFYEYPVGEGKKYLWPELQKHFGGTNALPVEEVRDRLLYIQSIETIRCLEERVLESTRDANIGSIFGIGFPGWTGGAIQFVNHVGVKKFAERAEQLRSRYGDRFAPPALLLERAAGGEAF